MSHSHITVFYKVRSSTVYIQIKVYIQYMSIFNPSIDEAGQQVLTAMVEQKRMNLTLNF